MKKISLVVNVPSHIPVAVGTEIEKINFVSRGKHYFYDKLIVCETPERLADGTLRITCALPVDWRKKQLGPETGRDV